MSDDPDGLLDALLDARDREAEREGRPSRDGSFFLLEVSNRRSVCRVTGHGLTIAWSALFVLGSRSRAPLVLGWLQRALADFRQLQSAREDDRPALVVLDGRNG